ncbi:MAG: hypothetical protein ABI367_05845 [Mucilaginibacter sp.]
MKLALKYELEKSTLLSKEEVVERIYETIANTKFVVSNEEPDKISFEQDYTRVYLRGDKALDIELGVFSINVVGEQTIVVLSYYVSFLSGIIIISFLAVLSFFVPEAWFVTIVMIILVFMSIPRAKATCKKMLDEIVKNEDSDFYDLCN